MARKFVISGAYSKEAHSGIRRVHQSKTGETLPTQYRAYQGAQFEPFIAKFRRWNHWGTPVVQERGANPQGVPSEVHFDQ
jgi:hypothetical protein